MTETTSSTSEDRRATAATRETVQNFVAAWIGGDIDRLQELLADDVVWYLARSIGEPIDGRNEVARGLAGGAAGRFVKLDTVQRTIRHLIIDGNHAIALVQLSAITHGGEQYLNDYAWHYLVEGGRIVRIDEYADTLLAARMGFLPFTVDQP